MEKTETTKSSLITLQRRKYKIPKLYLLPLADCLLLLLLFYIFTSKAFAPIPAIPVYLEPAVSPAFYYQPKSIFVKIENPPDNNDLGIMRLRVGSTSVRKADVQYDEMLSILQNLPAEHKTEMLIRSGRDVFHEQIIKVMAIGEAAGIGKIGFGGGYVWIRIKPRSLNREIIMPREHINVKPRMVPIQDRGGPIRFIEDE